MAGHKTADTTIGLLSIRSQPCYIHRGDAVNSLVTRPATLSAVFSLRLPFGVQPLPQPGHRKAIAPQFVHRLIGGHRRGTPIHKKVDLVTSTISSTPAART